jgi:hypothetical protein
MRPVHALALAMRPAEELVHGNAERLARDVPERKLDARDGLLSRSVRRLADGAVEIERVLVRRRRILSDQPMAEIVNETLQPAGDPVRAELAVPGEPGVRANRAEQPGPRRSEPVADDKRVDARDLHASSPCR